jgi:hypothetical protein
LRDRRHLRAHLLRHHKSKDQESGCATDWAAGHATDGEKSS